MIEQPQVPLARPEWNHEEYFAEKFKDVTILICQRNTRDLVQLCITSILNHYPEIKILVADGNSQDESIEWLRFMSVKHPNLKVWETGERRNSHGEIMHDAITNHITTKYVLLMDSDTIVRRGGFVEGMIEQFAWNKLHEESKELYAVGSLMLQSIKGEACSPPENEEDILRYAHPSCSMYDVEIYKTLRQFTDHGAPCALNNIDAQNKGYLIEYFPVDKYVQHLCGASWQEVPTVWNDDGDIQVRPLVTFLIDPLIEIDFSESQSDFNIVYDKQFSDRKTVSTYDRGQKKLSNSEIRFRINGHYICTVTDSNFKPDINEIRKEAIKSIEKKEDHFIILGQIFWERKFWQHKICML